MASEMLKKIKAKLTKAAVVEQSTWNNPIERDHAHIEPAFMCRGSFPVNSGEDIMHHLEPKFVSEDYLIPVFTRAAVADFVAKNLYLAPRWIEPTNSAPTVRCHTILGYVFAAKARQSVIAFLEVIPDKTQEETELLEIVRQHRRSLLTRAHTQFLMVDNVTRSNFLWPIWSDMESKWQGYYMPLTIPRLFGMHYAPPA